MMAEKLIGTDITPPDLHAKITGRAKYSEDFKADGMVFAKLLSSPMPHCKVTRIDASAALALPGVHGMLTADEVPQSATGEQCLTNHPHYEGEAILAIAADTETIAADAIELVRIEFEPLPFALDPLDSLRPGSPDARVEGNTRIGRDFASFKWTQEDFDNAPDGSMPMPDDVVDAEGELVEGGQKWTQGWEVGDVEAGLAEADLILDETIVHQSVSHHPLEPRSSMSYWENGRLFMHTSTQSLVQTRNGVARGLGLDIEDVVLIGEYCGGGFGSKINGSPIQLVPALFSRKINRPVMLRITRAEENYLGRARPGMQARVRIGFRSDGRITGLDFAALGDGGPFGGGDQGSSASTASLTYTPLNMRFRGVGVFTNTPPKAAQRGPGGAQIIGMLEPIMDKAARQLGVDRLALRRLNAPDPDVRYGPRGSRLSSVFVKEAIDLGRERFNWEERIARSGQMNGSKRTGIGVGVSPYTAGSSGFDGLLVIRPEDGIVEIHQGCGNLGTNSIPDTARAAADVLGVEWDQVEVVFGDTSRHLPWSSIQAGSQTTHAHTRANHAVGLDAKQKLQEIAARDLGGRPEDYETSDGRVYRSSNPSQGMTLARAATRAVELGGRYSGEEFADNLNNMTKASVTALAGRGLVAAARDTFGSQGGLQSWVVGFAEVALDVETGKVDLVHFTATTDCGVVVHPRGLGGQVLGGAIQGMGIAMSQKWVFDPTWGVTFAKRLYTARPPGILDVPLDMQWEAVGLADPGTPVGAKGIGEPCVGAGSAALTSAIADAMEGVCLCRTPLTPDVLLAEIEGREPAYGPLDLHV